MRALELGRQWKRPQTIYNNIIRKRYFYNNELHSINERTQFIQYTCHILFVRLGTTNENWVYIIHFIIIGYVSQAATY